MRGGTAAALAAALVVAAPPAVTAQAPVSQPACAGAPFPTSVFRAGGPPVTDWRENLAFDGLGRLWITNTGTDRVERHGPDGAMTLSFPVPGVAGIVLGLDGMLYVGSTPSEGGPKVVRFDPASADPSPTDFAAGTVSANGMTFDADGNLYAASDVARGIDRFRPDGSLDREWTGQADVWGPNGLAIVGDAIFTPITFDQRSPIERVPLADPAARTTLVQLSFGTLSLEPALRPGYLGAPLVPKGLDDLAAGPDGLLYVTAFSTGEVLRVDPETGFACVAATGLLSPTSVRFAWAFGRFEPDRDLFVTEASGHVRRVRLPARARSVAAADEPLLVSSRLRPGTIRRRGGRATLRVASRGRGELRLVFRRRAGSTFIASARRGVYPLRAGKRSIAVRPGRLRAGRYTVGLEARRAGERAWRFERTHSLRITSR